MDSNQYDYVLSIIARIEKKIEFLIEIIQVQNIQDYEDEFEGESNI